MKRAILFVQLILVVLFAHAQTNPFSNPSFEQTDPDGFCDRPADWIIKDATTGYSSLGILCTEDNVATDGLRSLQITGAGSGGSNNRAAAIQKVDLSHVDTLVFDVIGPANGAPQRANVNVYVDGELVQECGRVRNNEIKACKVAVAKYAGLHDFEIRLEQRRDDNLGNVAIDNIRIYDPCADAGTAPSFQISGPDTVIADLPNDFSIQKSPGSAFVKYAWYAGNKMISLQNSATHVFTNGGVKKLTVMATHCFDTDTIEKEVYVQLPQGATVSNFSTANTTIPAPDTITLEDESTNHPNFWNWSITPGNNDPENINFSFVNGTDRTSQNPQIVFLNPGTYSVCLQSGNSMGNDQACKNDWLTVTKSYTQNGDTLRLKNAHDELWDEHGEHFSYTSFPSDTNRYRKIYMYYNLSCAPPNCNDWDYTTQIKVLKPTGNWDTLITEAPNFRVDGEVENSISFQWDTTYNYYFNPATKALDSVPHAPIKLTAYNDPNRPLAQTTVNLVYPGDYYRYTYDTTGQKTDSTLIPADTTWQLDITELLKLEPETTPIEIGRVSTPYAGLYNTSWSRSWKIDVTDYASVLKDATQIRDYFRGNNSTGNFRINIGFEFIKGTPPRDNKDVKLVYESPGTGFYYGYSDNPIENHLVPKNVTLSSNAENSKLRVWINGHGFGGTDNCAEFCQKEYTLKINGSPEFTEVPWRSNCGMTPLYPQGGTWIYSRTNWCPGSPITPYDYETTSLVNAGENVTVDMDFEPFNFNQGNGTPSRWVLDVQVLEFGAPNFTNDAAVDQIISPNSQWDLNRYNPICSNPVIRIQNTGSESLTSLKIEYGVKGGSKRTYEWTGSLDFMETEEVELPAHNFGEWTGPDVFEAEVMEPNGQQDEYAANNRHESEFERVPHYPDELIVWLKTNNRPGETWYEILDANDTVVYTKDNNLTANTLYKDTVSLEPGCYRFIVHDRDGDGIDFWANNDGSGYVRLMDGFSTLKTFEPDFGSQIAQSFTVGFAMRAEEPATEIDVSIHPNPASEQVVMSFGKLTDESATISVWNVNGQVISEQQVTGTQQTLTYDVSDWSSGVYLVKLRTEDGEEVVKRFVKE